MPALNSDHLADLIGSTDINYDHADAVIDAVTAMAKSHTRGAGFNAAGDPADDLRAAILTASLRLFRDRGVASESMGPFTAQYRGGFEGWTVGELAVLNRWRVRAQ